MKTRINIVSDIVQKSLNKKHSMIELQRLVEFLMFRGFKQEKILNELDLFRQQLDDEVYEDTVLDVMDFLSGWCAPHMRIVAPKIEKIIELFARAVINFHGFNFNSRKDFSCFIPDTPNKITDANEGLLLWVFSKRYNRFETRIHLFDSKSRITKVAKHIKLSQKQYEDLFINLIRDYLSSLKKRCMFIDIGSGVELFGKIKVHNIGVNVDQLKNHLKALKEFESILINNPIVKFTEKEKHFECKNKNILIWKEFFS